MHFSLSIDLSRKFVALDATEVAVVRRVVAAAERLQLQRVARIATRAGNGWLYPLLTPFVVLARTDAALRFVVTAAISLGATFAIYPLLKEFLGRHRPCDYEPSLARLPEPLDHYSCPSGHAMTAAAYGVALIAAAPAFALLAVALWATISWSRVALGHHYVTDVLAGTFLGGMIAMTVAAVIH